MAEGRFPPGGEPKAGGSTRARTRSFFFWLKQVKKRARSYIIGRARSYAIEARSYANGARSYANGARSYANGGAQLCQCPLA